MQDRTRWIIASILLSGLTALDVCFAYALRFSWKEFLGYFSAVITVTGYFIYLSQMFPAEGRPPVKPEPLSWALFGFLTGAGWIIQLSQGGAAGSWCLGVTAFACGLIAIWSWLKFRPWAFDHWHWITAISALALFLFSVSTSGNAVWATVSAVLATGADIVSYIPTVRKAWSRPHEDSVTNFAFNSVKCIPALGALTSYSIATAVYLWMLLIVNGAFAIFLLIWRKKMPTYKAPIEAWASGNSTRIFETPSTEAASADTNKGDAVSDEKLPNWKTKLGRWLNKLSPPGSGGNWHH